MKKDSYKIQEISENDNLFPIKKSNKETPKKLFFRGDITGQLKRVAIVGTRKASKESLSFAKKLSKELSSVGVIIVSGLAFGIDSSAHKGALESNGKTWSVLAHGLDMIYPQSNKNLSEEILNNGGALISEYKAGAKPYPSNFLDRNKIIGAISDAVIVIEAPIKSGAISTAKFAIKIGTPVFVVPGNISSLQFEGSHNLIKDGCKIITETKDIFTYIGIDENKINKKEKFKDITNSELAILKKIKASKDFDIDNLIQTTTLNAHGVYSILSNLEIKGYIEKLGDKYIIKK